MPKPQGPLTPSFCAYSEASMCGVSRPWYTISCTFCSTQERGGAECRGGEIGKAVWRRVGFGIEADVIRRSTGGNRKEKEIRRAVSAAQAEGTVKLPACLPHYLL